MEIKVGTFNVNNLFSRFNFQGVIEAIANDENTVTSMVKYEFTANDVILTRTFNGKLVKGKTDSEKKKIAARILAMNLDVLAVQEIENLDILRQFNEENLAGLYPYTVLIEGNDERLIDVGLLSKLPLGAITSWQKAEHKDLPGSPIFSRDLLEVDVLSANRKKVLFKIFNTHLKSHYIPFDEPYPELARLEANQRRQMQSEMIAQIVAQRTNKNGAYIVVGDMNDPEDSEFLAPFTQSPELGLLNALSNPQETPSPIHENPAPASAAWTHRYKPAGQPAEHTLFDQIWISKPLKNKLKEAWIGRRKTLGGDGSDHDPAWVVLDL
ncbi:MAG TPA: hypothetical protein PK228_01935 [Saprospiraceae bacterium]|nr:hypothetical protein [Saprospiraceae bacterium]